jgi:ubiquinone/menaquinone biosynthesis C-methylase UbiE
MKRSHVCIFDAIADNYDSWYDTREGSAVFEEEVQGLRLLCDGCSGRWLEVGVGTGRFAEALGISHGVDLSPPMARKASQRGVRVQVGRAEQLAFRDGAFEGVLMALTLCFLADPQAALLECRRVLRTTGRLVIGTIPADSPWGRLYRKKAADGHPVYSHARFYITEEIMRLAAAADFKLRDSCSALFWEPGDRPVVPLRVNSGITARAGFIGLLFEAR